MAKYLITTTEVYRVDTEDQAKDLIENAKQERDYVLTKYNCEYKERKVKGSVEDSWFRVSLVKKFTDEKEPDFVTTVSYEVQG